MKNLPIIEVRWVDSNRHSDWTGRQHEKEDQVTRDLTVYSVGYLLLSKRDRISITSSYDPPNDNVLGTLTIPRCAVKSIRVISKETMGGQVKCR